MVELKASAAFFDVLAALIVRDLIVLIESYMVSLRKKLKHDTVVIVEAESGGEAGGRP